MSASSIGPRSTMSGVGIAILVILLTMTRAGAAATDCEARVMRAHQTLLADRLENWEPLDDHTVLIWTRTSVRARLVRLERPLLGLMEVDVIHLVDGDRDRLISPCGQDGIAIDNDAGVWQVARIVSIELLSKKRTAELDPAVRATALTGSFRI